MENIKLYLSLLIIASLFVFGSCSSDSVSNKKELIVQAPENIDESALLIDFINKSGDFINTKKAPTITSAAEVYDNLDKYLVIDIRKNDAYIGGHINGAVNVASKDLIKYMETKANSGNYEKVIIACYSGQTAAYFASLLHLLGYANVYSLKWGMSSWNKNIQPNKWISGISNKYANNIETKNNPKPSKGNYPKIATGKTNAYEILKDRVEKLAEVNKKYVKIDDLMANLDKYYIINYWPAEKYQIGHIVGSIQYTPKESLKASVDLSTLPVDKPIVVYCYTGQHAAYVVAYLQVLGYDAYTLTYGANSFMNAKMRQGIGHAFNATTEINDFPIVIGNNPSDKKVANQDVKTNNAPKKVLPKKKKKKQEEEGGC